MNLTFTPQAWQDYQQWLPVDRNTLQRTNKLIDDVVRHPFEGIGKPSPCGTCSPDAGRVESPRNIDWCISSKTTIW